MPLTPRPMPGLIGGAAHGPADLRGYGRSPALASLQHAGAPPLPHHQAQRLFQLPWSGAAGKVGPARPGPGLGGGAAPNCSQRVRLGTSARGSRESGSRPSAPAATAASCSEAQHAHADGSSSSGAGGEDDHSSTQVRGWRGVVPRPCAEGPACIIGRSW